jgi:EAL domain-containing protein (putative c-di-GMP-specific phosphodiesterase class I)
VYLIQIAHENAIKVVAEGIETEDDAKWLIENKADLLQGFYFAKPQFLS